MRLNVTRYGPGHPDTYYLKESYRVDVAGVQLAWEDTLVEAIREAKFIFYSYLNGSCWAHENYPELAHVLNTHPRSMEGTP